MPRKGNDMIWQPIETAPRDGTIVLLDGGSFFCETREDHVLGPFTASWYDGAWLIAGCEGGYVSIHYEDPTHWMKLPEPTEANRRAA